LEQARVQLRKAEIEGQQVQARERRLVEQVAEGQRERRRVEEEMDRIKEDRDKHRREADNARDITKVIAETEDAIKKKVTISALIL
jgi:hypothetical protein